VEVSHILTHAGRFLFLTEFVVSLAKYHGLFCDLLNLFHLTAVIMVFYPEKWVPNLPEIPDDVPICDFMLDEQYGRRPYSESWDTYTCALSGRSIGATQQRDHVEKLSRALAQEFGWKVNEGTEYDKVVGVFALNTVSPIDVQCTSGKPSR
jgi:hypothetical protein